MRINPDGKTPFEIMPDANWTLIPQHMHESVARYVARGGYVGDFLTALFSNDLEESIGRADDLNQSAIVQWVQFMKCHMPIGAHGSPENFREWVKSGGIAGWMHREAPNA